VTALRSTMTALIAVALGVTLSAQTPAPPAPFNPEQPAPGSAPPARGAKAPAIPLEVQIVLSRYQGEKRVSSMPYVMAVNANGERGSLNMGAEVAIPNSTFAPSDPSKPQPIVSFNYRPLRLSIWFGVMVTAVAVLYALWVLVLASGMRRGELAGVRWDDVDLDAGVLAVRRSRVSVAYAVHESDPKTRSSRRATSPRPTSPTPCCAARSRR